MHIRPILSTLSRHKTAAALIVLEIALTCAIVSNALFVIGNRLEAMARPTGLVESELINLGLTNAMRIENADALTQADLATLRALPGVKAATVLNQVPFGTNRSDTSIGLEPEQASPTVPSAAFYVSGEHALTTMGLELVAGRDFQPDEYRAQSEVEFDARVVLPSVILNQPLAERLFPGGMAVGKDIYVIGTKPSRIIGVVKRLEPPAPDGEESGYALMVPVRPSYIQGSYLLRVEPSERASVMKAAAAVLEKADTRRVLTRQQTLDEMRDEHYRQDRWMAGLLVAVCVALLVVTAFGIVGLASFWVQQRTRMIGVRRALGASRAQILRYFQLENFLLTGFGIVLGMAGAFAINQVLMLQYAMPRLPWLVLPIGALALWLLGQLAVLGPARRAANLPPVAVMRGA